MIVPTVRPDSDASYHASGRQRHDNLGPLLSILERSQVQLVCFISMDANSLWYQSEPSIHSYLHTVGKNFSSHNFRTTFKKFDRLTIVDGLLSQLLTKEKASNKCTYVTLTVRRLMMLSIIAQPSRCKAIVDSHQCGFTPQWVSE